MLRYFRLYITLVKMNFARLVIYRGHFFSNMLSTVAWGSFLIIQILLLTTRAKSVYGWNRNELLLLGSSFNIIIGLFHLFFSRSFSRFSVIIDQGNLDHFLLKPVDSQFLLSNHIINLSSIIRVFLGILFNIYLLSILNIRINAIDIILYSVLVVCGIAILYSIWFSVCTLMIWFTKLSNLIELLYTLNGFTRFPPDYINEIRGLLVIFLLPLTFIVATPTAVLLHRASEGSIFGTIVTAILFLWLSRLFWKRALRFYTSASS